MTAAGSLPATGGPPLPLQTERLRLRRLSPHDLAHFQAYRADPEVGRYQGWRPLPDDEAAAFLQAMAAAPWCPSGDWFQLGVAERDSDMLVGDIGLCLRQEYGPMLEIGFTLAATAQRRGLATEAVQAARSLVFAHTDAARIVAISDARNAAALRLLDRLRFSRVASLVADFRGQPCLEHHHVCYRTGRGPAALRPARAADATAVAEVLVLSRRELMPFAPAAHGDEPTRAWVGATLIPSGGVTVAEFEGRVVGVLAVSMRPQASWIDQLYVHPAHVGAGIGSALLAQALAALPRPLRLYSFQANLAARAFYERHGFVATAFSDGQGNEERCPDVLYELAPAT